MIHCVSELVKKGGAMNKAYHFTSSPKKVAVDVEKELLFNEREKERNWSEIEIYNGQSDILIFLNFGKISLENLNRRFRWDERRFCG